jgi:AcrR family transcriptional regulator
VVSTRERILLAAEAVVLTDGVACLTLEKAAVRAGLSKGGVLYHFKTRNDLVGAMVERLADRFDEGVRAHHAAQPPDPGRGSFARAYVEECLAESVTEEERHAERVGAAVIAAIASEPKLLEPLRRAFERWQREIEDDAPDHEAAVRATVARFAADGLWLCELFGIDALTPTMREALTHELLRMVN